MSERKNVLLLFSKLPEAGLVKTRLTTLKDGMFSPEVAAALYHRMLFDVVEIICCAFDRLEADGAEADGTTDSYELVISTAPLDNVERMEKLFADSGTWPRPIAFIGDEGATFDEHYNDAFAKTWALGADCILSMGADMPALTVDDVVDGFRALHRLAEVPKGADAPAGGIVIAPDQEMGVSVIGWTRDTDFDHDGVFYNQEGLTVLPAYVRKAAKAGLSAIYLRPVPDVDTMGDLIHTATLLEATGYCAPFDGNCPGYRTWEMLVDLGLNEVRIPPNDLRDPREHLDREDDHHEGGREHL